MNETEQAIAEVVQQNKLYKPRAKSQAYPEIAADVKKSLIASAIAQQREALTHYNQRIDLTSMPQVQAAVEEYMQSCEQYGTLPTVLGLAAFMGYSRRNLYAFLTHHSESETAQYLDNFRSASAAIIAQASAARTIDNATSIFLLKNSGQGLADTSNIEITRGIDPVEQMDKEAQQKKIQKYLKFFEEGGLLEE